MIYQRDIMMFLSMPCVASGRFERSGALLISDKDKFGQPTNFYLPSHGKSCFGSMAGQGLLVRALNTDGFTSNNQPADTESPNIGGTRLGRIVGAGGRQLLSKLNSVRKNFPMKVFLLLLGFYTANALATILGQTGDWDVLVAGVVVAAIEGIGMLMYRRPVSTGRLQQLVVDATDNKKKSRNTSDLPGGREMPLSAIRYRCVDVQATRR